jgi:hypothetical protein
MLLATGNAVTRMPKRSSTMTRNRQTTTLSTRTDDTTATMSLATVTDLAADLEAMAPAASTMPAD